MTRSLPKQRSKRTTKSQNELGKILTHLPDIVYKIDPQGIFTFLNNAIQILGYEPKDLIGKHFSTILHPDDVRLFSRKYALPKYRGKITGDDNSPKLFDERRTGTRKTKNLIVRLIPKRRKNYRTNQKVRIAEVLSFGDVSSIGYYDAHIHRKDKKFLGTFGIIRDITEQKEIQDALAKSREEYRNIVELAPDAIVTLDTQGIITSCNCTYAQLSGYSKDEIIGKHFAKMPNIHPHDIPQFFKIFHSLLSGKTPDPLEVKWLQRDGVERTSDIKMSLLRREKKVYGFQVIARDITQQKINQSRLCESEKRLRIAQEIANVGDWSLDLRKPAKQAVTWSDEMYRIFGVNSAFNPTFDTFNKLAHPDDQNVFSKSSFEKIPSRKYHDFSYRIIKQDTKEVKHVYVRGNIIRDTKGKPIFIRGTLQDITLLKEAEEIAIQRTKELEALNELSSVVSTTLNLKQILNSALSKVLHIMNLDFGGIYLADYERKRIDLLVYNGISEKYATAVKSIPVDQNAIKRAAKQGKLGRFMLPVNLIITNLSHVKPVLSALKKEGLQLNNISNVLLYSKEKIVGLLVVGCRKKLKLSDYETSLLSQLAQQISSAIINSQLYLDAQREIKNRLQVEKSLKNQQKLLVKTQNELKIFSQRLLTIKEEEKKKLSSYLHDELGSMAVALNSHLNIIEKHISKDDLDDALIAIQKSKLILKKSISRLKKAVFDLRPPDLEIIGLPDALREYFSSITKQTNLQINYTVKLKTGMLDENMSITIYRIAQESINNILKHSEAKSANVELRAKNGRISLSVKDDGRGFDVSKLLKDTRRSFGLRGMREMTESLEGIFSIESKPNKGTRIHIDLPLKRGKK
jgi:PAS domain S-box-containing protein